MLKLWEVRDKMVKPERISPIISKEQDSTLFLGLRKRQVSMFELGEMPITPICGVRVMLMDLPTSFRASVLVYQNNSRRSMARIDPDSTKLIGVMRAEPAIVEATREYKEYILHRLKQQRQVSIGSNNGTMEQWPTSGSLPSYESISNASNTKSSALECGEIARVWPGRAPNWKFRYRLR